MFVALNLPGAISNQAKLSKLKVDIFKIVQRTGKMALRHAAEYKAALKSLPQPLSLLNEFFIKTENKLDISRPETNA